MTSKRNESQTLYERILQHEASYRCLDDIKATFRDSVQRLVAIFQLRDYVAMMNGEPITLNIQQSDIEKRYKMLMCRVVARLVRYYKVQIEDFVFVKPSEIVVSVWGTVLWRFMHSAAILGQHYMVENRQDVEFLDDFVTMTYNVDVILPCMNCVAHYRAVKDKPEITDIMRDMSFGLLVQQMYAFHKAISYNVAKQYPKNLDYDIEVTRNIYANTFYGMHEHAIQWHCYPMLPTRQIQNVNLTNVIESTSSSSSMRKYTINETVTDSVPTFFNSFAYEYPIFHTEDFIRLSFLTLVLFSEGYNVHSELEMSDVLNMYDYSRYRRHRLASTFSVETSFGNVMRKLNETANNAHSSSTSSSSSSSINMKNIVSKRRNVDGSCTHVVCESIYEIVDALLRDNTLYETLSLGSPPKTHPRYKMYFANFKTFKPICRTWIDTMSLRRHFNLPQTYFIEMADNTHIQVLDNVVYDYE
ncbi:P33 [Phenacoccus solenopsis nudivirus]|nr:P33 [Phenacoccus solenopsis nudivirus]